MNRRNLALCCLAAIFCIMHISCSRSAQSEGNPLATGTAFTVRVLHAAGSAPIMVPLKDASLLAYEVCQIRLKASDPDNDQITYGIENKPAGTLFSSSSGLFEWTPTPDDTGKHTLVFTASDGANVSADTVRLSIAYAAPPFDSYISVMSPQDGDDTVYIGDTMTIKWYVNARDLDRPDVAITLVDENTSFTIFMADSTIWPDNDDVYVRNSPDSSKLGIFKWEVPDMFMATGASVDPTTMRWHVRINALYNVPSYEVISEHSYAVKLLNVAVRK